MRPTNLWKMLGYRYNVNTSAFGSVMSRRRPNSEERHPLAREGSARIVFKESEIHIASLSYEGDESDTDG